MLHEEDDLSIVTTMKVKSDILMPSKKWKKTVILVGIMLALVVGLGVVLAFLLLPYAILPLTSSVIMLS